MMTNFKAHRVTFFPRDIINKIGNPNATSEEKQLCKSKEHFLENNLHLGIPFNDVGKK